MKNYSNASRKPEDIAKQFEALQKLRRQVYQAELKALRDVPLRDARAKAGTQMTRPQKPSGARPKR